MAQDANTSPVESIPPPEQIRARLTAITRERALLMSLLKVSQRMQQYPPSAKGGPPNVRA